MSSIKLPVVELFHSIQGEGIYTGVPSIFLRVTGCNLRCVFKDSICDTSYTSFKAEKPIFRDLDEIADAIHELHVRYPNTNHLVISGGEPMLYKEGIIALLDGLSYLNFNVTIETNGTMGVLEDMNGNFPYVTLYSVSPKLSTSVDYGCKFLTPEQRDRHAESRIKYDKLAEYYNSKFSSKSMVQLKFVYSGDASVAEIKQIIEQLNEEYHCEIQPKDILLMPEGANKEQLEMNSLACAEVCMREGWGFCDRLHIRIWNDKKGV